MSRAAANGVPRGCSIQLLSFLSTPIFFYMLLSETFLVKKVLYRRTCGSAVAPSASRRRLRFALAPSHTVRSAHSQQRAASRGPEEVLPRLATQFV